MFFPFSALSLQGRVTHRLLAMIFMMMDGWINPQREKDKLREQRNVADVCVRVRQVLVN